MPARLVGTGVRTGLIGISLRDFSCASQKESKSAGRGTEGCSFDGAIAAPRLLSVTVVGADNNDPRWHAVAEAVEFWNQQLADAAVSVRLGPIARLVQPVPDDALRQLSGLAVSGRFAGDIPQELERVQGEIVVALSTADLISFGLQ